jgi:hypothetical protein
MRGTAKITRQGAFQFELSKQFIYKDCIEEQQNMARDTVYGLPGRDNPALWKPKMYHCLQRHLYSEPDKPAHTFKTHSSKIRFSIILLLSVGFSNVPFP